MGTLHDNLGVALHGLGDDSGTLTACREALWYEQQGDLNQLSTLNNLAWYNYEYFWSKPAGTVAEEVRRAALNRAHEYYEMAEAIARARDDIGGVKDSQVQHALVSPGMHTAHNGSNPGTLFEPIDTMIEIRNAKQQMIESIAHRHTSLPKRKHSRAST